jgi:hypothetical protein
VLFEVNFGKLANGQFLTVLAWGIASLQDADDLRDKIWLFTKANQGCKVASASLWSALLSCYQLLIGMAYFFALILGLGHSGVGTSCAHKQR